MPQINKPRSRIFYGYWILLVCFICQVVTHGSVSYSFSLFVIPLDNEFGWSRAVIMTGNILTMLTSGIGSPIVGRLTQKYDIKYVIAGGAITLGSGFILLSLTRALWQFYTAYIIVGLGFAATGVIPTSMVIMNWFKKRQGLAIGILGTGIGVGGFVMPLLLGAHIIPDFGWRNGYLVCGIISMAVIIPLSLKLIKLRPEEMGELPDNGDIAAEKKKNGRAKNIVQNYTLKQARKTGAFWLIAIGFVAFSIANNNTFQNHVPHLQEIGFPAVVSATALSLVGIGSAVSKFVFGCLSDYIPPKFILIIGSVLQAIATAILINVSPESSHIALWIYATLLGLGLGSWLPALTMNTSGTFGLVEYGVILGIYNMLFMASGAFGPWLGGRIFDVTGSYHLSFVIGLFLYAVAIISMLLIRRPKKPGLVFKSGERSDD